MGMYDTIFTKVNDNVLNIQTKKTACFLDNIYWLDQVNEEKFQKGVTSFVDDWYLNDDFNSQQEINIVFIFVQGVWVDYAIVKEKSEIEPVREKLVNLWKTPELQNILLSGALKIEKIKTYSAASAFKELSNRFSDYAYVEQNLPEIMQYFDSQKNAPNQKPSLGFYFGMLSNTLIDTKEQKIKNFLKETTDFFAGQAELLKLKNEEILKIQAQMPLAVESYFLYSQYETFSAVQYSEEQVLAIYKEMENLFEEIKVWSSKAVVNDSSLINSFLCSHLIRETAGPLLNKKFMSLETITHNYVTLYDNYLQFLVETGASFNTLSKLCDKEQLEKLIVKNSFIFLSNKSWQPYIINADILGHKKYFDVIIKAALEKINFTNYDKSLQLNSALLSALVGIADEEIVSSFEVNGLNIKGIILDVILKSNLEERDIEINHYLKKAQSLLEEHIASSGVFSSNPKREEELINSLKSAPLFANLYSAYEKHIFSQNIEEIENSNKIKNKSKKI